MDNKTILLLYLEDNIIIREYIKIQLKEKHFNVIESKSIEEAIEYFKEKEKEIDLIIIDIDMGIIVNVDFINEIRNINIKIPIIGLTYSDANVETEKLKIQEIINRELNIDKLVKIIKYYVKLYRRK